MLIDGFDIDFYLKTYPKAIKFFKSNGIDGLKKYHYLNGGTNYKTYNEYISTQKNNVVTTNKNENYNLIKTSNISTSNYDNLNIITEINNLVQEEKLNIVLEDEIDIDYMMVNYPLLIKYYKLGGINGLIKCCNKFKIPIKKIERKIIQTDNLEINIDINTKVNTNDNNIDVNNIINDFNIKQIITSKGLMHLHERFKKIYNLDDYNDNFKNTIYFGIYSIEDLNTIKELNIKYLIFGGSDVDIILGNEIAKKIFDELNDKVIISISKNIKERLLSYGYNSVYFNLNLVNYDIFKKVENTGKKIFIYNGITKGNEHLYGKEIYEEVIKKLPEYEYIFSNELNNIPNEQMFDVYKECFIGLRLTPKDGNANMVQEMTAMSIPVIHNGEQDGIEWKTVDDIIKIINDKNDIGKLSKNKKILTIDNFESFNLEYDYEYEKMLKINRGDIYNELNLIENLKESNKTVYVNRKFLFGDINKKPQLSIVRGQNAIKRINIPKPKFSMCVPYDENCDGIYCITQSWIEEMYDKNSLLYPHVYDLQKFEEINKKPIILIEQKVNKNWYNWMSDEEIKELRKKYYPEDDMFIICICGRIAINSYPFSLLEAIKKLREDGHNIQLLILGELRVDPKYRLTQELYDEITSYEWVKSFIVSKKDVLNYYRICDVLASTYWDYCNVIAGSNKIKEFLLCDKPILCSRGKERERELGKDYFGLYDCYTCNKIPSISWSNNNVNVYKYNIIKKEYQSIINKIKIIKHENILMNHINFNDDIKNLKFIKIFIDNDLMHFIINKIDYFNFTIINNLNDADFIFSNDINIIKKMGNIGKIVLTTNKYDEINTILIDNDFNFLFLLSYYLNYHTYKDIIINNYNIYSKNNPPTKTVVYIPVWQRHNLLEECINSIKKQTEKCIIIGICSNINDYIFIYSKNIIPILTFNKPLGIKYQFGVEFCKIFYPKNVIIMGSDDIMTDNYVKNINKYVDNYDIIGLKNWQMYDIKLNKTYKVKYNHKITTKNNNSYWGGTSTNYLKNYNTDIEGFNINICKSFPYTIGAGRSLGYKLLNYMGWKIYINLQSSIDTMSLFKLIVLNKRSYITLESNDFYIISLKDFSTEMITTLEKYIKSPNLLIEEIN